MKYRKRPIVVEAHYWDGTDECLYEMRTWTVEWFRRADAGIYTAEVYDKLHDTWVKLCTGDYVIQGLAGEFYPCEKAVFDATYEPA